MESIDGCYVLVGQTNSIEAYSKGFCKLMGETKYLLTDGEIIDIARPSK